MDNFICVGEKNGFIMVSGSGGNLFYVYVWSEIGFDSMFSNFVIGIYFVYLIDVNVCLGDMLEVVLVAIFELDFIVEVV